MKRYPSSGLAQRSAAWLLAFSGLLVGGPSQAIGFGSSSPAAALGQPLDFRVELRLGEGESLEPRCVQATVTAGDNRLPAEAVLTELQAGDRPAIRVRTRTRILEPVVAIDLAAGCPSRVSRQFVVFADPPQVVRAPAATAQAAAVSGAAGAAQAVPRTSPVADPARSAGSTAPPQRRAAAKSPPPRRPATGAGAGTVQAPATADGARTPRRRPGQAGTAPERKARSPGGGPRLRLDAVAPPAPPATPEAASEAVQPPAAALDAETLALIERANEAVKVAIAAASAAQARMGELETELLRLRAETEAQRAQMQALRAQAQEAESHSLWLLLLTVAMLGLVAWLWWRVRHAEHQRRRAWLEAARQPGTAARPPAAAPVVPPPPSQVPMLFERSVRSAGRASLGAGLAPAHEPKASELPVDPPPRPPAEPDVAVMQTQPLVQPVTPETRDVSAEELIDLEQQAEFFVVLGQDEEAIDLLVAHLRQTAGASPLPYLKLMDIYARHGDEAAYRRTRDRFNHRFQARAPSWAERDRPARDLEAYPAVLAMLAQVWPRPLDALAQLEALIFRRGGSELFDLPAYRDLLFLYALVRDLLDGVPGTAHGRAVDVLLPLDLVQPDLFDVVSDGGDIGHDVPAPPPDLDAATLPMARRTPPP